METTEDQYWECPTCGFMLTFLLKGERYVSYCPFCNNRLEIDKEEYENDDEVYFDIDK